MEQPFIDFMNTINNIFAQAMEPTKESENNND